MSYLVDDIPVLTNRAGNRPQRKPDDQQQAASNPNVDRTLYGLYPWIRLCDLDDERSALNSVAILSDN